MDEKGKAALMARIVDAGIALAYNPRGAGIAAVWAETLRQHVKFDDAVGTARVDEHGVWLAPDWFASLSPKGKIYLIGHATMHLALGHHDMARRLGIQPGSRRDELLGLATDVIINNALDKDGIGEHPTDEEHRGIRLSDPMFYGYDGPLESGALYHWLVAKEPKGRGAGGQGKPQSGRGQAMAGCLPRGLPRKSNGQGEPQTQAEREAGEHLASERARATIRELSQRAGVGSAIADLLAPRPSRVSIRDMVRAGFERASEHARNRALPSYSRAGRREYGGGIVTPGKIGTEARVAFVGDVSGSMSGDGAWLLQGVVLSVAAEFPAVSVYFCTHTAKVEWEGWLRRGGDKAAVKKATGFTGGTSFAPAYEAVREAGSKRGKFDALVHFTDGFNDGSWPESPARKLIIALYGEGNGMTPPPAGAKVLKTEDPETLEHWL
jgi:hypothetical protein